MNPPHRILLMKGRGLVSSLIRFQTRGQFSHAALWDGNSRTVIEAWQGRGVQEVVMQDWRGVSLFDVEGMTTEQWSHALRFARSQLGKPYDYLGVTRFLTRNEPENPNDISRWFCSSLVFCAIQRGGVNLLERIHHVQVSPQILSLSPLLVETIRIRSERS